MNGAYRKCSWVRCDERGLVEKERPLLFLPDPARPETALSIVPTALETGTGFIMINFSSLFIQIYFLHSSNGQCLSNLLPLCKNESKYKIIPMTSTTGSLTHSYVKCFAQRLVVKQRQKETFIHGLLTGAFDCCSDSIVHNFLHFFCR